MSSGLQPCRTNKPAGHLWDEFWREDWHTATKPFCKTSLVQRSCTTQLSLAHNGCMSPFFSRVAALQWQGRSKTVLLAFRFYTLVSAQKKRRPILHSIGTSFLFYWNWKRTPRWEGAIARQPAIHDLWSALEKKQHVCFKVTDDSTYFGDLKLQVLKHQRFRSLPQGFWTYGASESQVTGALGGSNINASKTFKKQNNISQRI